MISCMIPHDIPLQPEIRCLERHLHKRIRTEPMASDKVFSEALKLKRLAVVLADEVAEACLSET